MLTQEPVDRYHAVYLIILLNGMGILMPWNMWITIAPAYYMDYKLVEVDSNGVKHESPYALNFLSFLGVASNVPNLILNFINLFITPKGGLERRIGFSLIVMGLICLITLIFTLVDTSRMITTFFCITMITVVVENAANGVYQNSLYGLVAVLPPQYTSAIVLGNNICGTLVSVISIITLVVASSIKIAAMLYFLASFLAVLACFGSLFLLPKLEFYNYHMRKANSGREKQIGEIIESRKGSTADGFTGIKVQRAGDFEVDRLKKACESKENDLLKMSFRAKLHLYHNVFKKVWIQCFNVWFVFFVTLTLFPTVMADVQYYCKSGKYDFFIPEKLFTPVTTYLLFNFFAALGSLIANFVQWPPPKWLVVPVVAQAIFIPLMLFCNFRPAHRTWGVWIYNVWVYIIIAVIMSTGSGYFSTVAMMYAPKLVETSKSTIAGMIAAFFLMFGIVCGVMFTFAVSWFIDSAGPHPPVKQ